MGHHGPVCLRSDGEPALRNLLSNVAATCKSVTILEHGPRDDPQANGRAEGAVRAMNNTGTPVREGRCVQSKRRDVWLQKRMSNARYDMDVQQFADLEATP